MSRYIRTKDGKIFEYAGKERTPYGDLISTDGTHYRYDCVLKEADTIEELCDKFVGVEENGTPHIFAYECDLLDLIHNAERRLGVKVIGYGSIWVDGNLIKVAEMNKEGDLELL